MTDETRRGPMLTSRLQASYELTGMGDQDFMMEGRMAGEAPNGEDFEKLATEMVSLARAFVEWPEIYDMVLHKVETVGQGRSRKVIDDELRRWEDENIPKLVELRTRHFQEIDNETDGHGNVIRHFAVRNLERHEDRKAVMMELCPILIDLVALDKALDKVIDLQGEGTGDRGGDS